MPVGGRILTGKRGSALRLLPPPCRWLYHVVMTEPSIELLESDDIDALERVADGVFDSPIQASLAAEFLADPRHHLAVAIRDGTVIGFASAIHYVHPDKPAELWINEIGVAPSERDRGIGSKLMRVLFRLAADLGCTQAWVLAEPGNLGARQFYRSLGGSEAPAIMSSFDTSA